MMPDPVVITGGGLVCALGNTIDGAWQALIGTRSGIKPLDSFEFSGFSCRSAATVSGIDPSSLGIHRRDARIMGRHTHMLIEAARDAYAAAGIGSSGISPDDIGFFAGMGTVDYEVDDLLPALLKSLGPDGSFDYDHFFTTGYQEIHPLWPLSMLNNISFCQAAIDLNIRGENTVFSPHADSGAAAVAEGLMTLLEDRARIVLAGGVSEIVSPASLARAGLFGILSPDDSSSTNLCRPFSQERRGTVPGEGCGILSLELRSSADSRGASYSAMIMGYGTAFERDADNGVASADAMTESMHKALESASLAPGEIDLIIAHGDGTMVGDGNEAAAIHQIFSENLGDLIVYSSKPALGHLFSAAPAVDLLLASRMISVGIIPAVAGAEAYSDAALFQIPAGVPVQKRLRRIMVNGFSCEGHSSTLIIGAVRE
jgi:3-oxoacyl-[acyl-carrier-protein] synthase II